MKLLLSSLALCITVFTQPTQANPNDDCKEILDIAQDVYSPLFPANPKTEFIGPWCFRCYPNKVCAGMHRGPGEYRDNAVYTLGGVFGDTPYYVGQADEVLAVLRGQRPDSGKQNEICDTSGLSNDITYRTEGDTTYVSTNGQCIELPDGRGICDTPSEKGDDNKAIKTNVHLLTTTTTFNLEVSGINIPGYDTGSIVQDASNHCIIHAPSDTKNHTVHTDICIDVTNQITGSLGGVSIPGFNPPITTRYEGTSTLTRVDDCFDTNAASITNLVTKEFWQKQGGSFVKIN